MPKQPRVTGVQLARAARRDGFEFVCQEGSHATFHHPERDVTIGIPMWTKVLRIKTTTRIRKGAGWSIDRMRELLGKKR